MLHFYSEIPEEVLRGEKLSMMFAVICEALKVFYQTHEKPKSW